MEVGGVYLFTCLLCCDVNDSAHCLHMLVYHGALRFILCCGFLTHQCFVLSEFALCSRCLSRWYVLFTKFVLVKLQPTYLLFWIWNMEMVLLCLKVRTELGKKAFGFSAATAGNNLQTDRQLRDSVTVNECKAVVNSISLSPDCLSATDLSDCLFL